jgi:peptidoglycan DL-endopeptidase CwlO
LRSLARRLAPVIALVLAAAVVAAGLLSHAGSRLAPSSGLPGPVARQVPAAGSGVPDGGTTDVSQTVAAIPGVASGRAGHWKYAAGQTLTDAAIAASPLPSATKDRTRLGRLFPADVLVVGPRTLPGGLLARIRRLPGVVAAVPVDAGRIQIDGVFVNVLGVDPAAFRRFAPKPTARSAMLWQNIAAGGIAISYTMGSQDRLTLAKPVQVTGARTMMVPVAGFGTVGIGGVDAVVSDTVASSLGLPSANAIVISAPKARLDSLIAKITRRAPHDASVAALVTQVIVGGTTVTTGAAGATGVSTGQGAGLSVTELATFLAAAKSRLGMPYVWGGAGPATFDCSGLVQWAMRQAGVVMPRVAADQARTGPLIRLSQLQPGDLLFYHTDPTAPQYISHVAIYIGSGMMLQAPEPGMDVEIVPADFGAGFAGAVQVYPGVAAAVAANAAG